MQNLHRTDPGALLGPFLLAAGLVAGCLPLPRAYDGDYAEFAEARQRAEAERAARAAEREAERAASEEPSSSALDGEAGVPAVVPFAPAGEPRLDAEVAQDVREALRNAALLAGRPISVRVEAGLVTLEGVVVDVGQAAEAVTVASRVDGVQGVYDELEIEERAVVGAVRELDAEDLFAEGSGEALRKLTWSDNDVQRAIESYFARTAELDPIDIEVRVEDDVVVLTGRVSSAQERKAAAAIAARVGARPVRNELEVGPAYETVRPRDRNTPH